MSNAPNLLKVVEDFFLTDVVKDDRDGGEKGPKKSPEDVVAGRGGLDNDSHEYISG